MTSGRAGLEAKFKASADERLSRAMTDISFLEENPDDQHVIERLARDLHTVKGEARMLGLAAINDVCHLVEDLVAPARRSGWRHSAVTADLIARGLDLVGAILREPGMGPGRFAADLDGFRADAQGEIAAVAQAPAPALPEGGPRRRDDANEPRLAEAASARVPTERLDALTAVTASLLLRQAEQGRQITDLRRLASDVRDGGESARTVDAALAGRLLALAKEMEATLARVVDKALENRLELRALQEGVQAMRLLPLRLLFDAAPAAARELARQSGKQVKVLVEGADVAVDKQVLDVLDPVLVHLIRNAIDHGLESPAERARAGKAEQGTLVLAARQAGGAVEVEVQDDGRGLDVEVMRAAAVRLGLLDDAVADSADAASIFALAFEPGFTTKAEVTDLSGRGVGLDVVKRDVQALGGSVRLEGERGQGASVRLVVPISAALARFLVAGIGEGAYAFPSPSVDRVLLLDPDAVEPLGSGRALVVDGAHIPFHDLAHLLGFAVDAGAVRERVVILKRGDERLALAVARVIGEREAVQRTLDPVVSSVGLLSGTAIVDGGLLVLACNVGALFDAARRGAQMVTRAGPTAKAVKPRVLIVDDSELTRDMLVHLAGRLGAEAWEAVDGHDALARLERERPDIVLTDLDMPVVDGIALIEQMRRSPALRDIPVIVLSTRGSAADKKRAMDAGANAYLVKAAFQADDLRRALEVYITLPG